MSDVATLGSAGRDSYRLRDDDRTLVAAVRRGDDDAFAQLYERYRRRITAYAFGFVHDHARAEDVTQDVFLSALRRMRCTSQPIAVQAWLYEIARNACIDQHRRARRHNEVSYDVGGESERLVAAGPGPAAAADAKARLDDLRHAFRGLTAREHELLILRDVEGLSYREIGQRMQLKRAEVERGLASARLRLADEYEELSSGTRCRRVQSLISAVGPGHTLGAFERVRIGSHVVHCSSCRVHVRRAGLRIDPGSLPRRLAALIPLPAWLRRSSGSASAPLARAAGHAGAVAPSLGPAADWPAWTAATVVVASVGIALGAGALHPGAHAPAHRVAPVRASPTTVVSPTARRVAPRSAAAPVTANPSPAAASGRPHAASVPRGPAPAAIGTTRVRSGVGGRPARRIASPTTPAPSTSTGAGKGAATSRSSGTNASNSSSAPSAGGGAAPKRSASQVVSGRGPVATVVTSAGSSPAAGAVKAVSGATTQVTSPAGNVAAGAGSAASQAGNAVAGTVQSGANAAAGVTQAATSATPAAPIGQAGSSAVSAAGSTAAQATSGAAAGAGTAVNGVAGAVSQTGHTGTAVVHSVLG